MVTVPEPAPVPVPPIGEIDPIAYEVPSSTRWYRVYSIASGRSAVDFNPGSASAKPTRFAFFEDDKSVNVPVLYAAQTEVSAVCESILHDVPASGGNVQHASYIRAAIGAFTTRRPLTLANFMGTGLRRLRLEHGQLTSTDSRHHGITVQWARAAHRAGFDGLIWMSHRCNTDQAIVLFGDRVRSGDLSLDPGYARIFSNPTDRDWLVDMCTPLHVEVVTR
ncbi:RES family NAD+ phosphorylase [Paeniglutamicibacter kerguelensis]